MPSFVFLPVLCSAGPLSAGWWLRPVIPFSKQKDGRPPRRRRDRPSTSWLGPSCLWRVVFRCPDSTAVNASVVPQSCLLYLRVRRAVMVDGMSMREAARTFGLHQDTVRKMLAHSVPPGYRRQTPPGRPKLSPTPASSTGSWRTTSGGPGSSDTQQSASSSGSGTSTGSTADTPRSRAMQERVAVRPGRCSSLCPMRLDTPSATLARSWWSLAAWSRRPTALRRGWDFTSAHLRSRVCGGNGEKGKRKVLADWRILARRRAGPTPAAGRVVGAAGRVVLLPLPPVAYDACDKQAGRVSSLSLVRYRTNDYSVPVAYGYRDVLVRGYVDAVVISCGIEVIASHPRSYERDDFVYDPVHYLPLLERKSRALDQAAPL